MITDHCLEISLLEAWLRQVGEVTSSSSNGFTVELNKDSLNNFAEFIAASQRELIARTLETMPDGLWANRCGNRIRTMRAEH